MTKKRKRIDNRQIYLFDIIKNFQEEMPAPKPVGSMNIDRAFREAISEGLKGPLGRYQIAVRMSELTDTDITKTMLDSWTAESKVQNRFPAVFLPAFCEAAGSTEPLRMLGQLIGVFVLPGPEALRAEIQRIDEEITRKQAEKRRRLVFLKEMEGAR